MDGRTHAPTVGASATNLAKALLLQIAASAVMIAPSPAAAATPPADVASMVRERRDWVRQADQQDYFYWKRFLYRHDNPGEFPLPPGWYNPQTLVTGTPSAPLPMSLPTERLLSPAAASRLDAYLAEQDTGAFYVARDGRIAHAYFGADTHAGSLLPVRSVTKSLLSLLVGAAVADGKIASIDERIGNYLPEWSRDPRGSITIRQILHMATGLEYVTLRLEPANNAMLLAEGSDVNATALSWRLAEAPDRTFSINQVDSQLLGIILQRATGKPLDEYLSEKIWRPLGLSTATLNIDARGNVRAFCCMRMVGADLLKIGQMLIQGGLWEGRRILPEQWIREMQKPSPASADVGLHVFLGRDTGTPEPGNPFRPSSELLRAPGVFYFQGGLSVVMWMIPSERLVIFRWGNDKPGWDMSRIPNLILDDLADRSAGKRR
jgi:CubicO group peptidase (beta-lactamase class C family)